MKRQVQTGFCLFAATIFLTACEPPQRAADQAGGTGKNPTKQAPVTERTPVAAETLAEPLAEGVPPVASDPPAAPIVEKAPEEPALDVSLQGNTITVSGGLRSRIQVERIIETLTREFPNRVIENHLHLEYHRNPVGWGNRVADELLVPYFTLVKSPHVAYSNCVVTLEGTVESGADHRKMTEMAMNAFSGSSTESIDNRIKVKK